MAQQVKNSSCNEGDVRDAGSVPGLERFPWRRKWQPTPVFLPEKSHGQRSLAGYSPKGGKESDTIEQINTHIHTTLGNGFFGFLSHNNALCYAFHPY